MKKEFRVGERWCLKPYEQVVKHYGISKMTWDGIRKRGCVISKIIDDEKLNVRDSFGLEWFVDTKCLDYKIPDNFDYYRKLLFNSVFGAIPETKEITVKTENLPYLSFYNDKYFKSKKNAIKNVKFNNPATIIFWEDGTKTVVKCENEEFDPEKGLAMAIAKRFLGDKGNYYETFKKWLPETEEREPVTLKDMTESMTKFAKALKTLNGEK